MRHLGIDVHTSSIVFHLLDATGQTLEQGKIATTEQALSSLVMRLGAQELLVGQEVGKMSHFVHDVLTGLGVKVLSFNAHQLRMIASSRKKSDKRDAYWIAKALQSGMTPHPVYIPTGEVRELRALLSQRSALVDERRRWLLRARSYLRAAGHEVKRAPRSVRRLIDLTVSQPEGLDARLWRSAYNGTPRPCRATTPGRHGQQTRDEQAGHHRQVDDPLSHVASNVAERLRATARQLLLPACAQDVRRLGGKLWRN